MWAFLNPMFLWAAAAAAVPLILHLIHRRRTVVIPFSTVRFLKLAQKRSSNRIKMENLLLWLVRTLLMLFIALAFAMPILRTRSLGSILGSAARDVAIVWDVSYSMGYESGSRKVWDESRESIAAIVRGLKKGDRVCIFLADDDVTPLIEKPTSDLDLALSLIKSQELKPTTCQLRAATMAALEAFKESTHRERELYIVTDGQTLPWSEFGHGKEGDEAAKGGATTQTNQVKRPPTVTATATADQEDKQSRGVWDPKKVDKEIAVFVAMLGPDKPENVAPLSVEVQPALLMADSLVKVSVKLGHTGPPQTTSVSLFVDDKEMNRRTAAMGEGAEDIVFNLPPLGTGVHTARVETPVDGLLLDNTFYFLLRVKEQLPVLVVGTEADTFFLMRALNPGGQAATMKVTRVDPDALTGDNLNDYSCVFLVNAVPLPGQALLNVERYVKRGGVLVIFPGDRGAMTDYESWNVLPAKPKNIQEANASESSRQILRLVKPRDPLFRTLKLPPGTAPSAAIRRGLLWNKLEPQGEAIISAAGENGFLLSRYVGSGRVLMFAVSADRRWSDLPLSPMFLPILHQIVQFGAGLGRDKLFLWPAKVLALDDIAPDAPEGASLLSPKQQQLPIRRIKKDAAVRLEVENALEPGIYRLSKSGGASEPVMAVNVPRDESNLTPLPLAEVPTRLGLKNVNVAHEREELIKLIDEHRKGRPLGESVLWLVFGLGMFELFLANKFSRKKAVETKHVKVHMSGRVVGKAA